MPTKLVQTRHTSSVGDLFLIASEHALEGVFWSKRAGVPITKSLAGKSAAAKILARAAKQIDQYLAGRRTEFDLPLSAEGTEFQIQVWASLLEIPYGKTVSYGALAKRLKRPGASRAVGTANAKNPLCIVIPCHRVVPNVKARAVGGYSGGAKRKAALLALELAGANRG